MGAVKKIFFICIIPLLSIVMGNALAGESSDYLIQVAPNNCKHGILSQPNGGPFSVFIFCDDAAGVNIGIVLTEPGAGPGSIELTGHKAWDGWDTNDRFWQNKKWATDVVSFAWSPSLKFAYVGTSGVYGDGGLFKLSLVDRTFSRILPNPSAKYFSNLKSGYLTSVKTFDVKRNKAIVEIYLYGEERKLFTTEEIVFE